MPSFLTPDHVRFEIRQGQPVLSLSVEVPDGPENGWTLLNRLTLCVVDGPGEAGYLFPRAGGSAGDLAPAGWDDAVDAAGGSTVVFGSGPQARTVFASSLG
jgi:hypothetical protein